MKPENPQRAPLKRGKIFEKVDARLLSSLEYQYQTWTEAIQEITDNCWDARIEGRPFVIFINLEENELTITDRGGKGMGLQELEDFFVWGVSEKRGKLGRYGYGGKAAMTKLARSVRIVSSLENGDSVFTVEELDWDSRPDGFKEIDWVSQPRVPGQGSVQLELKRLKHRIDPQKLAQSLGDTYRLALKNRGMTVVLNGQEVPFLEIPTIPEKTGFEFTLTGGEKVTGWLGQLKEEHFSAGLKPGIRGCVFERKIEEGLFFGHPEPHQEPSMRFLIGEFNINSETIPLMAGKNGFEQSSPVWEEISVQMHILLTPLAEKLIHAQPELRVPRGDGEMIKSAYRIVRLGLIDMGKTSFGIRPARETKGKNRSQKGPGEPEHRRYLPRTPAPEGAVGQRKRLANEGFINFLCRDLGPGVRSAVVGEPGERKLLINPNFAAYRESRNRGSLVLHLIETAALELAKPTVEEEMTIEEYLLQAGRYYQEFIKSGKRAKLL